MVEVSRAEVPRVRHTVSHLALDSLFVVTLALIHPTYSKPFSRVPRISTNASAKLSDVMYSGTKRFPLKLSVDLTSTVMPLGSVKSTWLGPSIWVFGNRLNTLAKAHSVTAPRTLVPVPQIPWPIFWSNPMSPMDHQVQLSPGLFREAVRCLGCLVLHALPAS